MLAAQHDLYGRDSGSNTVILTDVNDIGTTSGALISLWVKAYLPSQVNRQRQRAIGTSLKNCFALVITYDVSFPATFLVTLTRHGVTV